MALIGNGKWNQVDEILCLCIVFAIEFLGRRSRLLRPIVIDSFGLVVSLGSVLRWNVSWGLERSLVFVKEVAAKLILSFPRVPVFSEFVLCWKLSVRLRAGARGWP